MNDFFKFLDNLIDRFRVHVEIYYSHTMDWCIYVYKKDCANDYPGTWSKGNDAILCNVQSCDMEYAFAKAQVDIKNWLMEFDGGY